MGVVVVWVFLQCFVGGGAEGGPACAAGIDEERARDDRPHERARPKGTNKARDSASVKLELQQLGTVSTLNTSKADICMHRSSFQLEQQHPCTRTPRKKGQARS